MKAKKFFLLALKVVLLTSFVTVIFTVLGIMCATFYQFLTGLSYNGQNIVNLMVKKPLWLLSPAGPSMVFGAIGWIYLNYPNSFLMATIALSLSATAVVLYREHQEQKT